MKFGNYFSVVMPYKGIKTYNSKSFIDGYKHGVIGGRPRYKTFNKVNRAFQSAVEAIERFYNHPGMTVAQGVDIQKPKL